MLEGWPHVCCVKIAFTLLSTNRVVSTTTNSMQCVVNWIPLRICVHSRNTQPHLKSIRFFFKMKKSILKDQHSLGWGSAWVCCKLGNAPVLRSWTGSWVLSDSSGAGPPLRLVIRLVLRNPKNTEIKKHS